MAIVNWGGPPAVALTGSYHGNLLHRQLKAIYAGDDGCLGEVVRVASYCIDARAAGTSS